MKQIQTVFAAAMALVLLLSLGALSVFASPTEQNVTLSVSLDSGSNPLGSVKMDVEGGETNLGEGTHSVLSGKKITLTATPKEGFVFIKWEVLSGTADFGDDTKTSVSFTLAQEDVKIKAVFSTPATYMVEIAEDTIHGEGYIPGARNLYREGESVTVEAHAYEGSRFVGWKVDPSVLNLTDAQKKSAKLTFTQPNHDVTLSMDFEFIPYYFTVKIQGRGEVEIEGKEKNSAGKYACHVGEEIVLRATAKEEYAFVNWTGLNGPEFSDSTQDETTLTCPASDFTVIANFASSVKNLTIAASDGGTVEPEAGVMRFGVDNILNLKAYPQLGYAFSHWECSSENGKFENEKAESTTFSMPEEDCTVTAVFIKGGYRLTVTSSAGGKARGEEGVYEMGTKAKITAIALEGYVFSRWESTVDGAVSDPFNPETEVNIPGKDVKVTAVFILKTALDGSDQTPTTPGDEAAFPWGAIAVIFLLSAVAITLVILRERYNLSYLALLKNLFRKKSGK